MNALRKQHGKRADEEGEAEQNQQANQKGATGAAGVGRFGNRHKQRY